MGTRDLSNEDARSLEPGSEHYTAYVGPPDDYDLIGSMQFRLLCTLGLRAGHRLLDFGCGSLRAGRLLIPYLQPGHYYGVEPNRWLIDDAIEREVGADQIRIKRPRFLHHATFGCREFGVEFDYIIAQSIFSHCGADLVAKILGEFSASLAERGLIAATFVHPEPGQAPEPSEGWIYPACVSHEAPRVLELIEEAKLHGCAIPWLHPRQTWWLLAHERDRLPPAGDLELLHGAVLEPPAASDGS